MAPSTCLQPPVPQRTHSSPVSLSDSDGDSYLPTTALSAPPPQSRATWLPAPARFERQRSTSIPQASHAPLTFPASCFSFCDALLQQQW